MYHHFMDETSRPEQPHHVPEKTSVTSRHSVTQQNWKAPPPQQRQSPAKKPPEKLLLYGPCTEEDRHANHVVWDLPPQKHTEGFFSLITNLLVNFEWCTTWFCPPVVHDYEITVPYYEGCSTASSSHESLKGLVMQQQPPTEQLPYGTTQQPQPERHYFNTQQLHYQQPLENDAPFANEIGPSNHHHPVMVVDVHGGGSHMVEEKKLDVTPTRAAASIWRREEGAGLVDYKQQPLAKTPVGRPPLVVRNISSSSSRTHSPFTTPRESFSPSPSNTRRDSLSSVQSELSSTSSRHRRNSAATDLSHMMDLEIGQAAGEESTQKTTNEEQAPMLSFSTHAIQEHDDGYTSPLDIDDESDNDQQDHDALQNASRSHNDDDVDDHDSLVMNKFTSSPIVEQDDEDEDALWPGCSSPSTHDSSTSWLTAPANDDNDDARVEEEEEEFNNDAPVYLPKCPVFEKQLLQQQPNAFICVSGWVAYSLHDDSVVHKMQSRCLKQKDLAYLVLLGSGQPVLYLFQQRKQKFVRKAMELSHNGVRVESRLINPQFGHAVLVLDAPSRTICALVPVSLGTRCFQPGTQHSILVSRLASVHQATMSPFSATTNSTDDFGDGFAPVAQHEAVMHIRFALDSLIRTV